MTCVHHQSFLVGILAGMQSRYLLEVISESGEGLS